MARKHAAQHRYDYDWRSDADGYYRLLRECDDLRQGQWVLIDGSWLTRLDTDIIVLDCYDGKWQVSAYDEGHYTGYLVYDGNPPYDGFDTTAQAIDWLNGHIDWIGDFRLPKIASRKRRAGRRTAVMFDYDVVTEVNPAWSDYDKTVAQCHLVNYGEIYIDAYGQPIDNEYDLMDIEQERGKFARRNAMKKKADWDWRNDEAFTMYPTHYEGDYAFVVGDPAWTGDGYAVYVFDMTDADAFLDGDALVREMGMFDSEQMAKDVAKMWYDGNNGRLASSRRAYVEDAEDWFGPKDWVADWEKWDEDFWQYEGYDFNAEIHMTGNDHWSIDVFYDVNRNGEYTAVMSEGMYGSIDDAILCAKKMVDELYDKGIIKGGSVKPRRRSANRKRVRGNARGWKR